MTRRDRSDFVPNREDTEKYPGSFRTAEIFVHRDNKLHTVPVSGENRPEIPFSMQESWTESLSFLKTLLDVSCVMVMRIKDGGAQVFIQLGETADIFTPGKLIPFGSGSSCEDAIGHNGYISMRLDNSPFRCYCGMPLHWEDGSFFGTLCIFSSGGAPRDEVAKPAVTEICASIEKDLHLLHLGRSRDEKYEKYAKAMEAVLQYSPGGIFSYSAEEDEQFSYISDNMLAFLGYTKDEFVSKFENRFSLMVYEEDRERVIREINEQIELGPFDRCEYRIEKKDGSLVWVHDDGHIVADAAGKNWFYVVIVDITESVRAQQQEREIFRSSIRTLLAANPEAAGKMQLNLTRNTCVEDKSALQADIDEAGKMTAEGFFAETADRIAEPELRERFLAVFDRKALLEGFQMGRTSQSFDYPQCRSGKTGWVRMHLTLLSNPDTGDVEGVAYSMDISEEKQRSEILKVITSQEHDLIALIHLDRRTVEAYFLGETLPAAFREILPSPGSEYGLNEFRLNAMECWIYPEDREKYLLFSDPLYYIPIMDKGENYEFVLRECFPDVKNGVMFRKFQHRYLGSDRDSILVIESDVTKMYIDQQQELETAKAETERIKDIMDSITCGISVLRMPDPDRLSIVYVNQQMFRLLGFTPDSNEVSKIASPAEQLVREYTADAFAGVHPDDIGRVREIFRENFMSEYFVIGNYRTLGAGGKYYWIKEEVRLKEITPEFRVFYATYHDVNEEVRLNSELTEQLKKEKRLRQEATAANSAKTEFLSRMSHDIRTPLNGIIGMTYIAKEQENPPKTIDCLNKIDRSSKFLLGLINDVLDMSRAESNKIKLNPEPYPLDEFNSYLDAVIRPLCREKNQKFSVDEDMAIRDFVPVADKLRTNQIILNLLSNAVKYTPEGGTITYKIGGKLLPSGRVGISHEILDTGIGMSEEFQKILFEPFSQEGRDDSSYKRGSGLGLAIVKKLVDLMGGSVSVKSKPGKGTAFRVYLEFDAVPEGSCGAAGRDAAEQARRARLLEGRRILLCEDHPLNQEIAKALLERQGAAVETAENGLIGVKMFEASPANHYDAVLMDIRMPVMDGYEATRKIRALPRSDAVTTPILAMTADAFDDDVRRCLEAGMNAHISKPIDPELLNVRLAETLKNIKEDGSNG